MPFQAVKTNLLISPDKQMILICTAKIADYNPHLVWVPPHSGGYRIW